MRFTPHPLPLPRKEGGEKHREWFTALPILLPSPQIAGEGQGVRGRFVNPTTDGSPATPVTPAFYSDPTSRRYT